MRGGGLKPSGSSCSSEEEDGDARWKARILSAAAAGEFSGISGPTGSVKPQGSYLGVGELAVDDEPQPNKEQSRGLKLYQIKARKLLDDVLDNSLMIVQDLNTGSNSNAQVEDCGVRLFHKAPHGIIFDRPDVYPRPTKRPQIIPREEIDEKSKKFRRQIRHAAVEGVDVMASAEDAMQRSSARFEARDAAAKAAAKREEERIAELKKVRGEKWLPALARQKQVDIGRGRRRPGSTEDTDYSISLVFEEGSILLPHMPANFHPKPWRIPSVLATSEFMRKERCSRTDEGAFFVVVGPVIYGCISEQ